MENVPAGAIGELCDERGDVLVGDRPMLIAHCSSGGVAQGGAKGAPAGS
jgi:hypothetical protein